MYSRRQSDRPRGYRPGDTDRFKLLFAAVLVATLAIALLVRRLVSADALLPLMATMLFTVAVLTTGIAIFHRRNSDTRITWMDIAGIFAAIGVAVSILIEPHQMIRLVAAPDQSE